MHKKYIPVMLIYTVSFSFFVAAAIGFFTSDINWATYLLIGFLLLLFASSRIVKVGKKLREEEESEDNRENDKE